MRSKLTSASLQTKRVAPSKTIRDIPVAVTSRRSTELLPAAGYELAIACDEIYLVDDGNSAISLPEVPLLGVLPGTGGLTRLVDKRKVRRDRADVFSTLAEGLKGKRAKEWGLIDDYFPTSKFQESIDARVSEIVGADGVGQPSTRNHAQPATS